MKNKHLSKVEGIVFVLFCLANLIPLFFTRWFPSLDGPAHIYSANLVKEILVGNKIASSFFSLSFLIPNLIGSLLLSLLQFIFPAWLAEKILIALIVTLLPVGFRYLVYSFRSKPTLLTLAVFPFTWHFLFMIGFYNYSLALAIMLFILGYYIRTRDKFGLPEAGILGGLLLLLAFTHVFVFALTGIVLLVLLAGDMYVFLLKTNKENNLLSGILKRYWKYATMAIPGIFLMVLFVLRIPGGKAAGGSDQFLSLGEHLRWLYLTRPLVIYTMEKEMVYGIFVALVLAVWLVVSLLRKQKENLEKKGRKTLRYFLLAAALLVLLLYFILPDYKAGTGGHLSLRMLIPFYLLFLVWLATRKLPQWLQAVGIIILVYATVSLWSVHMPEQKKMNLEAELLVQAGMRMPASSVVLPVNAGDNWIETHFLNYLGAENPVMVLENTVASGSGFIRWADPLANLPARFGGNLMFEDTALFSDSFVRERVDAVVIWKANQKDLRWPVFSALLSENYVPYDTMCGGYGWIFIHKRFKPNDTTLLGWTNPVPPVFSVVFDTSDPRQGDAEFFDFGQKPLQEGCQKTLQWYRLEAGIRSETMNLTDSVYLTCMIENKGKTVYYDALAIYPDTVIRTYRMDYHPPVRINKGDVLKMYLWNPKRKEINVAYGKAVLYQGK